MVSSKIEKRALKHGRLFIKRGYTIRKVSEETGTPRQTVHNDLHRLEFIHPELYKKVLDKINYHLSIRHIRGGHATKEKYKKEGNN